MLRLAYIYVGLGYLMLSGCAATPAPQLLTVYVSSSPPGAFITLPGSQVSGVSNVAAQFNTNVVWQHADVRGCFELHLVATWVSGAQRDEVATFCMMRDGGNISLAAQQVSYALQRPAEYPGLEKDMQFALQVAQVSATQQAAAAAQWQAAAAQQSADAAVFNAIINAAPINCSSTTVGGQVITSCN